MNAFRGWPPIEKAYDDEFGTIDQIAYDAASAIWPLARAFAVRLLGDESEGQRLLLKAAAVATSRRTQIKIDHPSQFIYTTFRHLVLAELRLENRRSNLLAEHELDSQSGPPAIEQIAHRHLLVEEVRDRLNPWARQVFDWLVIGYTFEEVAGFLGKRANAVRSRFSKQVAKVRQAINRETEAARKRSLR